MSFQHMGPNPARERWWAKLEKAHGAIAEARDARDKLIVEAYVKGELTLNEIRAPMGMSPQQVTRILVKAGVRQRLSREEQRQRQIDFAKGKIDRI